MRPDSQCPIGKRSVFPRVRRSGHLFLKLNVIVQHVVLPHNSQRGLFLRVSPVQTAKYPFINHTPIGGFILCNQGNVLRSWCFRDVNNPHFLAAVRAVHVFLLSSTHAAKFTNIGTWAGWGGVYIGLAGMPGYWRARCQRARWPPTPGVGVLSPPPTPRTWPLPARQIQDNQARLLRSLMLARCQRLPPSAWLTGNIYLPTS